MDKLREAVVDIWMSGRRSPGAIARTIVGEDPPVELIEQVEQILEDPGFHKDIQKLQADPVAAGFERCRRNVHEALLHIERCMAQTDELRTKLAASKLILEIGGITTIQRHEVFTPRMYEEQLRPLMKKEYRALDAGADDDPSDDEE